MQNTDHRQCYASAYRVWGVIFWLDVERINMLESLMIARKINKIGMIDYTMPRNERVSQPLLLYHIIRVLQI